MTTTDNTPIYIEFNNFRFQEDTDILKFNITINKDVLSMLNGDCCINLRKLNSSKFLWNKLTPRAQQELLLNHLKNDEIIKLCCDKDEIKYLSRIQLKDDQNEKKQPESAFTKSTSTNSNSMEEEKEETTTSDSDVQITGTKPLEQYQCKYKLPEWLINDIEGKPRQEEKWTLDNCITYEDRQYITAKPNFTASNYNSLKNVWLKSKQLEPRKETDATYLEKRNKILKMVFLSQLGSNVDTNKLIKGLAHNMKMTEKELVTNYAKYIEKYYPHLVTLIKTPNKLYQN